MRHSFYLYLRDACIYGSRLHDTGLLGASSSFYINCRGTAEFYVIFILEASRTCDGEFAMDEKNAGNENSARKFFARSSRNGACFAR